MQVLRAELVKAGKNEFFNGNQYTGNKKDYRFIQKALRYDEDIAGIVTEVIFSDYTFPTPEVDAFFKKAFTVRFLNREIGRQTLEDFSSQVVYTSLIHEQEIEAIYHNFNSALANENRSVSDNSSSNQSNNSSNSSERSANTTLPQDQVNLNLDKNDLAYADDNSVSKSKREDLGNSTATGHSETSNTSYNAETFKKLQGLWEGYFNEYDRRCFLQTW